MTVLPDGLNDRILFFEQRLPVWNANALLLGLTPAQVTDLTTLVTAARAAFTGAQTARNAAKAATVTQTNAVAAMTEMGADYIKTIKARAATTNNPGLYATAQIPPPSAPTPAGAPDTPTNLTGVIDASGILTLAWNSTRAGPSTGIVFQVSRKTFSQSAFGLVGSTFETRFVDSGFDAADGPFLYRVQAVRGSLTSGFAGPLTINVGAGASTLGGIGGETIGDSADVLGTITPGMSVPSADAA